MNLALLGVSGAGKGTHAASLSRRFQLSHVATGDLLRENLRHHTALGILVRKHLDHLQLVPDEVVDAMIEAWCDHLPTGQGALFDGFPRTASQARFLDRLLRERSRELDAVIYLHVPDHEITSRLAGRFICQSCQLPYHQISKPPQVYGACDDCGAPLYHRPDDASALVRARLREFHRTTPPVFMHYAACNRLAIVSGIGTIEQVETRLIETIAAIQARAFAFATADQAAALVLEAEPRIKTPVRPTLDLVLLGPPGSGKGTQAAMLSRELGLPHIATGDLFRENLRDATELGCLARTYMDAGELVPDHVTEAMVEERLSRPDVRDGFILDGFPRTLPQAHALTEMLNRLHRHLTGVLHLQVADAVISARLSGRLTCRNCQAPYHVTFHPPQAAGVCDLCGRELYQRPDDHPPAIAARLAAYHDQTEPLIAFYRQARLLHEVAAEGSLASVSALCLDTMRRHGLLRGRGENSPPRSPVTETRSR